MKKENNMKIGYLVWLDVDDEHPEFWEVEPGYGWKIQRIVYCEVGNN
jgi:hypothetical protein